LNLNTKRISESRDLIWLNKTNSQHIEITQEYFATNEIEENDFEEDQIEQLQSIAENEDQNE
jgi:hypothetical protein